MSSDPVESQIEKYTNELIGYLKDVYDFHTNEDLVEILRAISAYRARASLIRQGIVKSSNPKFNRFRIDSLDPFLAEMAEQFKIFSRVNSVEELNWQTSKG